MRLFAVAALATLGFAVSTTGGGTSSGLRGLVTEGPTHPVCRVNEPCSRPAVSVTLIFARNGRVAGRAITNRKGWYRISLRPGRYAVSTNRRGFYGRKPKPSLVTVPRNRVARRDFSLDTGIR